MRCKQKKSFSIQYYFAELAIVYIYDLDDSQGVNVKSLGDLCLTYSCKFISRRSVLISSYISFKYPQIISSEAHLYTNQRYSGN